MVKILPLRTGPLAGLQKLVYVVYFRAPGGILPEITFYQNSTRISTRNQKGPRWHQKWISSAQGGGPGRPPGGPSRPLGSRGQPKLPASGKLRASHELPALCLACLFIPPPAVWRIREALVAGQRAGMHVGCTGETMCHQVCTGVGTRVDLIAIRGG